jgi:hypothetical protein
MKPGLVLSLALGFLALVEMPLMGQPRSQRRANGEADEYGWLSSLEEGKARARQSGRPLMVVVRCVP